MAITIDEFNSLKPGQTVCIVGTRNGNYFTNTGYVEKLGKNTVKIRVYNSNYSLTFLSPTRVRSESTSFYTMSRWLATAAEFHCVKQIASQQLTRRKARKVVEEMNNLAWSQISAEDASKKVDELQKLIADFS